MTPHFLREVINQESRGVDIFFKLWYKIKNMPNMPNYSKICQDLLKDLAPRTREIISRRFGFKSGERETLESIGESLSLTRERVRQIEAGGFSKIKQKLGVYEKDVKLIYNYLKGCGGLKKEDVLLAELGGKKFQTHIYFLLSATDFSLRFSEDADFYPFWFVDQKSIDSAKETINFLAEKMAKEKVPSSLKQLYQMAKDKRPLSFQAFSSFIEISKKIEPGIDNFYGLKEWPEVNPRGSKDKAFLALKKEEKPLHFREIALAINKLSFAQERKALPQTVHNELIKDPRFVLVGRGIYALRDWGYEPGYVKDVILNILKEKRRAMSKEDIIKEVLKQRMVKTSTILLNLQDKKQFIRNPENKYTFRVG